MNWRRITDAEMITELTRRGYVVRRNAAPRAVVVTFGDPPPAGWQAQALEKIRERIGMDLIDFEHGTSANDIEMNTATLRIL